MKMFSVKIGKREIGKNKPVFIIAEAGVNYNNKLSLALKMVDAAKNAAVTHTNKLIFIIFNSPLIKYKNPL